MSQMSLLNDLTAIEPGNTVDPESDAGVFHNMQSIAIALNEREQNRPKLGAKEVIHCEDCGKRIAEARRNALIGVQNCIKCALASEQ
jgi:RNA polymerase-binding transcription factor DksA